MDLIIDGNNLASRMFFVLSAMSEPGSSVQKGAIFGFLDQVLRLRERFSPNRIVFCFDSRQGYKRKEMFPGYKQKDPNNGGMGTKDKKFLRPQIAKLEDDILPRIGFSNVFSQKGYEADDLIAVACESYQVKSAVIVSSDKDLYQCLRDRPGKDIRQYVFKEDLVSTATLEKTYGVTPVQWSTIKAMCGDESDCIPGVYGVKEKIACKFLLGQIACTTKIYKEISANKERVNKNLKLMHLPLDGCEMPEIQEDGDTPAAWDKVSRSMGLQLR